MLESQFHLPQSNSMTLIDEIIEELSKDNVNLTNALIKAQILASTLDGEELAEWVESELTGYKEGSTLPSYRVLGMSYRGTISNGYQTAKDFRLPTGGIPKDKRDKILNKNVVQSIAVIEKWVADETRDPALEVTMAIDPAFYGFFVKGLTAGFHPQVVHGHFGAGALTQLLTEVRSRLLGFILKLKKELPVTSTKDLAEQSKTVDVAGIFHNTVLGDGAVVNIAIGTNNSVTSETNIHNDLNGLLEALRKLNIPEADIAELKQAIKEDGQLDEASATDLGPKVKGWIGGMFTKAGTALSEITTKTIAGVITPLIIKYYEQP